MSKRQQLPDIVVVRWRDACFSSRDNVTKDDEFKPIELYDVGFVVKRDKTSITLSSEHCPNQEDFRHVLTIPLVNVVSIRRLNGTAKAAK